MGKVVSFPKPSKPAFEKTMRELADAGEVVFVSHATQRLVKRGVSHADVIRCLQKGKITEGPLINIHGNQQATVERFMCGEEIRVVVAIEDDHLVIITVMQ